MDVELLRAQLKEAEAAYHRLMTGASIVMLKDSNGEQVQYSAVNRLALMGYIQSLRHQLGLSGQSRPMRPYFV